jgi:hypothetical protein
MNDLLFASNCPLTGTGTLDAVQLHPEQDITPVVE